MNRYDVALKIGIISFLVILVFLISMNFISEESASVAEKSILVQGVNIVLSLAVTCSGLFLWFTGFSRFKTRIGNYGIKWLMYATCTIFSGFYMQYRYGNEANI